MSERDDGRRPDQLREVRIDTGVQRFAAGSALVAFGRTEVLCAASLEPGVPRWLEGADRGWVTAEYGMLPGSTPERQRRPGRSGPGGRVVEIQRLIGRSLRQAVDLGALGQVTVTVDCDVVSADGGTRTAAITGGWVALVLALRAGAARGLLEPVEPVPVSAVSVGVVGGTELLDLPYDEDAAAEVDCNVVAVGQPGAQRLVEVQGSAEGAPFSRPAMERMLDLAEAGCDELAGVQLRALQEAT